MLFGSVVRVCVGDCVYECRFYASVSSMVVVVELLLLDQIAIARLSCSPHEKEIFGHIDSLVLFSSFFCQLSKQLFFSFFYAKNFLSCGHDLLTIVVRNYRLIIMIFPSFLYITVSHNYVGDSDLTFLK